MFGDGCARLCVAHEDNEDDKDDEHDVAEDFYEPVARMEQ